MRSELALAALASAAVPGMQPVAVASIGADEGEGRDCQRAVVEDTTGRRWLVRVPLSPVAGARLRRNDDLVRHLSRHVPFKVPSPTGHAAVGEDGQAAVYPYVEGSPLDLARLPGGPGLTSAVGRTVAAIHNIPLGAFEEQDVPAYDAAGCRRRLTAAVDRAAETGRVPTGLLARWEEAFEAAPLWQFATTPVHGSFGGASLLVVFADDDADSGRVVAVTGWEEAMIADPATDLAELYSQASPAAWEAVLDSYALARAQRPDPYLHARARLVAETRPVHQLARAVEQDREDLIRRAVEALRRIDRSIGDEDSLVPTTARRVGAAGPVEAPAVEQDHGTGATAAGAGATGAADPGTTATDSRAQDLTMEIPSPGPPPEDEPDDDHDGGTAAEIPEAPDLADEERLHELYGMPDPESDRRD